MDADVRGRQRLAHFRRALAQLRAAVDLAANRPLSELEQQGVVKSFELTFALAWNTLRDFLSSRGVRTCSGPEMPCEPVTRQASSVTGAAPRSGWR
ncbi:MAG: nucleotidyltransferase substrate binding protein [Thermaerobacter sp.]|nr:nucleotidyltransferase substrate binding protein [Thermaerobacter sp.]